MSTDPKYTRRTFLKDSVVSVARAAQEFVRHRDAPREEVEAVPSASRTDWLRPPGAVEEPLFFDRCTRCNDCAEACPHGSIRFDSLNGTPVIFPDQVPCWLCEDFPCIAACETEALLGVSERTQVRMGLARVSHRVCTAGEGCHACVSKCPTVALRMDFTNLRLVVESERCVGCGLCEHVCHTVNDHIAIRVVPVRVLEQGPV